MPKVSGIGFIIKVNTGTIASPVYTTVGGQRNATLSMGTDEIDVTDKASSNWHEGLPSIRNWSIEGDGLLVQDDSGLQELEDAFIGGEKIKVQLLTASGKTYTGDAILTDFSYEAPYDDAATASYTLTGSGALTPA